MAIHSRIDGEVLILNHLGHLMNDPRYTSASDEVEAELQAGRRQVVIELADVRETGHAFLGLLMSLTRRIRQSRGEVVLARPSAAVRSLLKEMQLDDHWDIYERVDQAVASFRSEVD